MRCILILACLALAGCAQTKQPMPTLAELLAREDTGGYDDPGQLEAKQVDDAEARFVNYTDWAESPADMDAIKASQRRAMKRILDRRASK